MPSTTSSGVSSTTRISTKKTSSALTRRAERKARAEALLGAYHMQIRQEDRGFVGGLLELPTVRVTGVDAAECQRRLREAGILVIGSLLDANAPIPPPADIERRILVNVRLSSEEKQAVIQAAKNAGLSGITDLVRAIGSGRVRVMR